MPAEPVTADQEKRRLCETEAVHGSDAVRSKGLLRLRIFMLLCRGYFIYLEKWNKFFC